MAGMQQPRNLASADETLYQVVHVLCSTLWVDRIRNYIWSMGNRACGSHRFDRPVPFRSQESEKVATNDFPGLYAIQVSIDFEARLMRPQMDAVTTMGQSIDSALE